MPHEYQPRAGIAGNRRGQLAGERTFRFPMNVLDAEQNVRPVAERVRRRRQRQRRREERDGSVGASRVMHEEVPHERLRVRWTVIHLPVRGEHRLTDHERRSSSASTPGSGLPSRNSSEAPPPAATWLMRLSSPASATAAAESPPPTIVVAPLAVASAIAFATARVPASKGGVSNTPMGPFQSTVFAVAIARA